ncbi:hypothetical protein ACOSQ2_016774 [Xanthoceras sorbifolium]
MDVGCPFGYGAIESTLDATWGCKSLKTIHRSCGVLDDLPGFQHLSFLKFLLLARCQLHARELDILVIRFRGWTRVGSPLRSSNRTHPVEAAQPTRKAGIEAPVYPSSSGKREKFIVVNPAVTSLHVFNSPELMQEGKNQPFESNDILSCIDVGGALLVFKGSGTSGLFKPGVVQLDDKIVIVDCGGGQNHVPLQTASESVLGGRKKGWKRRTWTGMVIEEEAPISPQLGKRDSSIVGGADELQ